jgi:collagen triple helix repeat protein
VDHKGAVAGIVGYLRRHHLALVALFLAVGAGTSYAATDGFSSSSGPLYACVTKTFHTLNLTGRSATCPRGESKVSWNRTGPRGRPGAAGAKGKTGPKGPAGATGATGKGGPAGATGPAGAVGAQGQPGATGATGPAGTPGSPGAGVDALFGDGSDGDITINADTVLTRDMYYRNLTIAAGRTLNPGGFRIFVAGTLTLGAGAAIARNGSDGPVGAAAAPALPAGTLGGSGGGGFGACGVAGGSTANSLGGSGGNGFCGSSGTATLPPNLVGGAQIFDGAVAALSGRTLDGGQVTGGAGGGTDGGSIGDSGGSGGGVVLVVAHSISADGPAQITAKGGNGGPGNQSGGQGGGGGGGGVVVVISTSPQPADVTLSTAGGTPGLAAAPGSPGFARWMN